MAYAIEEDGDEIFTPMSAVRCCRVGFEGNTPIYSQLIPVAAPGHVWMCCDHCGGNYGEAPAGTKGAISDVALHDMVSLKRRAAREAEERHRSGRVGDIG